MWCRGGVGRIFICSVPIWLCIMYIYISEYNTVYFALSDEGVLTFSTCIIVFVYIICIVINCSRERRKIHVCVCAFDDNRRRCRLKKKKGFHRRIS